jgi:hypothetical protein
MDSLAKPSPWSIRPKFELMISFTATMALGFEVPTVCWSAPKILFAAVWYRCDMPSLAMNVGFQG